MAGRKRRKPDGVVGFIADVISDQQKGRVQTQRLEAKAQLAWAKENAKMATANARDRARQEQREAREREIAEGHAEAQAVTRALQAHLTELRTLLTGTLDEDPYLPFDRFKVPLLVAAFRPSAQLATPLPPPQASDFMPEPPSGFGALAPGRRRAYAEALARGKADYEQAVAAHARVERSRTELLARAQSAHAQSMGQERERVRRQHASVDQMARDFAEGKRKAVADYFNGVLTVQRYPSDFPTGVKVAYLPADPEKYQPVQPIIEYPWDDLHYAEELDAAAGLDNVQNLLDLDGYEFEHLLVKLCQEIPEFDEVRRTRSRADGGIDLVAVNKTPFVGGRVAIQAKRYAPHNKVDIAAVREIIGSISQREFTKGIIITISGFTSAARQEAERLGVELYDGERLLWLLRHHLHREFTIIDVARRKPPFKKPPNPSAP